MLLRPEPREAIAVELGFREAGESSLSKRGSRSAAK
jgi:hypothetical protein